MTTNLVLHAIVTCYLATDNPCANGNIPRPHYTVAAPRSIPLGTKVIINNHPYVVEDRLNKRFTNRWDIFVDCSRKEALKIGKQTNNITVITK
jgi:3D (Asp-Asp-Asp) domain-containing protein